MFQETNIMLQKYLLRIEITGLEACLETGKLLHNARINMNLKFEFD